MTNFYVVCKDKEKSCWYGNYKYIGIGSSSFKLYILNKNKTKSVSVVINFEDIKEISYTPDKLEDKKVYNNYNDLLKFDIFFIDKEVNKQISIFDI